MNDDCTKAYGKTLWYFRTDPKTARKLSLEFTDGSSLEFVMQRSCCEALSFDTEGAAPEMKEALFQRLMSVDFADGGRENNGSDDCHDWGFLKLRFGSAKGYTDVSVTAHNNHNGYYGGFMVQCTFTPAAEMVEP